MKNINEYLSTKVKVNNDITTKHDKKLIDTLYKTIKKYGK